jgi:hypothetical protein
MGDPMNSADAKRVKRVIAALQAAIDVFRNSDSKPAIEDIEIERQLNSLQAELTKWEFSDGGPRMG